MFFYEYRNSDKVWQFKQIKVCCLCLVVYVVGISGRRGLLVYTLWQPDDPYIWGKRRRLYGLTVVMFSYMRWQEYGDGHYWDKGKQLSIDACHYLHGGKTSINA